MSSSKTLLAAGLALALALPLAAACGFTPVYGEHSLAAQAGRGAQDSFGDVAIGNIPNREGQYLRNALIDRLYAQKTPSAAPRYFLAVDSLTIVDEGVGLQKDATTTRGQIDVTAKIRLHDRHSGDAVVLERSMLATAGYNRLDNLYASEVSQRATIDRLVEEMSDSITQELALYFNRATQEAAE